MSERRARLVRIGSVLAVIAIWALLARILGEDYLPGPILTAQVMRDGFERGWLWNATLTTLSEIVPAFAIAAVVGLFFGAILGLSRRLGRDIRAAHPRRLRRPQRSRSIRSSF